MKAPKDTIFYLLESTIKKYRRFAQSKIKEVRSDITIDQGLLLSNLIQNEEATQKELSHLIFKDMASISRMLDALEKNKFITRKTNPENRRRFLIKITQSGRKAYEALLPQVAKNRKHALKGVSKDELETLMRILSKISHNLD